MANVRTDEVQLRVVVDGSPARRELAQLAQESVKLQDELRGMKKGSTEATQAMERLAQIGKRQEELRRELGLTGLSLKELRAEAAKLEAQLKTMVPGSEQWVATNARLQEVKVRLNEVGSAAGRQAAAWEAVREQYRLADMTLQQLGQEMSRLRQLIATTRPNTPEWAAYRAELQRVEARQSQLNNQLTGGARLWGQVKGELAGAVAGFAGVGAAVYGVIRLFGDAAGRIAEFDRALSRIRALGGEYAANIKAIGDAALSAGTDFGYTATQSAQAVEALAKAGVTAEQILGGGLKGALTLAAAGNMTVAEAAEVAAKAMTQFGLSGADIPMLADLLSAGANRATGEVADFAQALSQSGVVMNQFKVPVQEAVGTLTAFAKAGLLGSDAGTSLRTMILRLGAPTEQAAALMEELGIKAYDANGNFVGLVAIAGQLNRALGGLSEAQRNAALNTIFGTDAIRAASIMMRAGEEGMADYVRQVNESGFAQKVAAENTNNLTGEVDRMAASWSRLVNTIERGDGVIAKSIRGFIAGITQLFDTLSRGDAPSLGNMIRGAQVEQILTPALEQLEQAKNKALAYQQSLEGLEAKLAQLRKSREENLTGGMFLGGLDEQLAKQIEDTEKLIAAKKEEAQAKGQAMQAENPNTLAALRDRLKELREAREQLNLSDRESIKANSEAIAQVQRQIDALEGGSRATRQLTNAMERYREQLAEMKRTMLQDALDPDERELAQLDARYEKLRAEMMAQEGVTQADLIELDAIHAQQRADLIEQQGQSRIDAERRVAERMVEAAKAAQAKALQEQQNAQDQVFLDQASPQDAEITALLQEYDAKVAIYTKAGEDTLALTQRYEAMIHAVRKRYRDMDRQERIAAFTESAQAVGSAMSGLQTILDAAAAAQGRSSAEQTEFQRTLALTQIGIASAVGVANAIKNVNEPFPANLIAIATGIGAVLSGIGQAMNILNSTPPTPAAPGGGQGATLNNVPLGADGMVIDGPGHDRGGLKVYDPIRQQVVAEIEGGETILSRRWTEANAAILPQLLAASKAGARTFITAPVSPVNTGAVRSAMAVPQYAAGGRITRGTALVNAAGPGGGGGTPDWALAMIGKMEQMVQAQLQYPTRLTAEVVNSPKKDRTDAEYARIKGRNSYRRSA